jgi:hypothetical protein
MKKVIVWIFILFFQFQFFTLANTTGDSQQSSQKWQSAVQSWFLQKENMVKEIYQQTNISYLMDLTEATTQLQKLWTKIEETNFTYQTLEIVLFIKYLVIQQKRKKILYDILLVLYFGLVL